MRDHGKGVWRGWREGHGGERGMVGCVREHGEGMW